MYTYMYQADLLCEDCGIAVKNDLNSQGKEPENIENEYSFDSDDYPKGPYPDGGGESDVPCHCGSCGAFLENPLTRDGLEYVGEEIKTSLIPGNRKTQTVIEEWIGFYGFSLSVHHIGYCGMIFEEDYMLSSVSDARRAAADAIKRYRNRDYVVSTLKNGLRWEIVEPEDSGMVPDDCGYLKIVIVNP